MHVYTLYSAVRPFGCSLICGSYGADGPGLYMIEPSGVSWVGGLGISCSLDGHTHTHTHTHTQGYSGCAVGKAKQAAKTELEKVKVCSG